MGAVQIAGTGGTLKNDGSRRSRSKLERRQIVEETLKAGASVARVARAHEVNANQVFKWRKLYREGRLDVEQNCGKLLPVRVVEAVQKLQPPSRRQPRRRKSSGIIDIDMGHARVRIEGAADPDCVRAALEGLTR